MGLLVASFTSTATATPPAAPLHVIAAGAVGAAVEVSWVPGGPAPLYRVYGLTEGGSLELIATTATTTYPVMGAYVNYGVSALDLTEQESQIRFAFPIPCPRFNLDPPNVWVEDCSAAGVEP